jgi:peroxiredoxin
MTTNLLSVDWSKIPAPSDDGAAKHLIGKPVPSIPLLSSSGQSVHLANLHGTTIVYAYPMTGQPDVPLPDGWDMLPGARGCTPQSCAFRDHFAELRGLGATNIFGLSTQTTDYQREAADRLHLPFALLSDCDLKFTEALHLPTFETAGMRLLKRLTMVISKHRIEHVFYPVFPPDRSATDVVDWLKEQAQEPGSGPLGA